MYEEKLGEGAFGHVFLKRRAGTVKCTTLTQTKNTRENVLEVRDEYDEKLSYT